MTSRLYKYIVFSLLVLCMSFTEREETSFTFVQLCDTQLGMGGYEHDVKAFRQAVQQINALHPDFVVICGDLVHNPTDSSYSDFKKIKAGFTMSCYCAPGNHDVGNIPNNASLRYYRKTIGKDYYEFQNKGYSFIVANSQLWKVNTEKESDKHDKWFKKTLQRQTRKQHPVFVIGHYPLYTVKSNEEEGYFNLPMPKRQELLSLFEENNVVAYLSGHTHKTVINNFEKIQLVSGETTSKNFDQNPLGFRVWKVTSDRIEQLFVALKD
jgi:3',5'-cyclic AMP phosphodiesterase CpdA